MPKISFVMPAKNREKLIGESISSIVNQTLHDWELVIVDDHSNLSDRTKEIVKKFDDARIQYFRLPDSAGMGVACARNCGNYQAKANIIAVIDSDDISMPNRAQNTLKSYLDYNWDVFYGKFLVINDATGTEVEPERQTKDFSFKGYMTGDFFIPHSSSAYTKKMAMHYPYNSSLDRAEDYDLFTRMAEDKRKFYYFNDYVYKYRVHADSISAGRGFIETEEQIRKFRQWKR